ncbi:MAG TPA: patatin-like phospholipase family protein [Steroidobacteraceae bacterium]|nr:patatin-like phospholipase family protein [Steroidobacteraceae bacterium]
MKVALVLSGGGMFGAWQAGAWQALAARVRPDLIVGASVGSLNGYAIAGGCVPEELCELWRWPELARWAHLPITIRTLMERFPLSPDYAIVLTDLLRLKPKIFRGNEITWQHVAASCAVPLVRPQQRIGGRLYSDGGLLNPLPVWAAVELGATHIVALQALPDVPSPLLKPFVRGFRFLAGHHPPLPSGVEMRLIEPGRRLGSMRDAMRWKRDNIERWLEQGYEDALAKDISIANCLER